MRVIERRCRGKRANQALNEDGLLVTDAFACVADGVTSKSVRRPWRPTGGVVAKDLLLSVIAGMPADAGMREVQRRVDERFRAEYRAHPPGSPLFEREPVERLQANAVVYCAARGEAWLFGDCQIMVNGVQVPTVKRVDELMGELRSFAAHALRLEREDRAGFVESGFVESGHGRSDGGARPQTTDVPDSSRFPAVSSEPPESPESPDPAREMILPFLRLQSRFANRRGEYGYFVFDGFTDPEYPIRSVPIRPGDEVVLASDGYPLLRPTLDESERELERLRREDPALIGEYRSTKGFAPGLDSFDDRTYLRFIA